MRSEGERVEFHGLARAQKQVGTHHHAHMELGFIAKGYSTNLLGGKLSIHSEGKFSIGWASIPHRCLEVAPGTMVGVIFIPISHFLAWRLPGPMTEGLLNGMVYSWPPKGYGHEELALLQRWATDQESEDPRRMATAMLELEARLRRWSLWLEENREADVDAVQQAGEPSATVAKVAAMAQYISEHYTEPVTVADVAHAASVHPHHAMKLFRQVCGQSIVHYITQHRIAHAKRLLATTDRKILDIAEDCGFGSPPRFYAAFSKFVAVSPAMYRKKLRIAGEDH